MDCDPTQCAYLSRASDLVLALAPDGTIRRVASRRPRTLGYEAAALEGRPLADLLAREQQHHVARILQQCEAGRPVWDDLVFRTAEGHCEPLRCCFQPMTGGPEKAMLLVTGLRRGTREAEARVEAAAALAHLAFRCHGPAHRLIQAVEALLAEHPGCEAATRCRDELDAILDAMSVATVWPALGGPAAQAVDVVRVLEQALRLVQEDAALARLKIELRPERPAIWGSVHPVGLANVALHLAANAAEATAGKKRPRLVVNVYRRGEEVVLEFADNGAGLPREDARSAFSPFFSAPGDRPPGCGLGLATCWELVHFMGGTIRLHSRPGKGTTVFLAFPAARPPQ